MIDYVFNTCYKGIVDLGLLLLYFQYCYLDCIFNTCWRVIVFFIDVLVLQLGTIFLTLFSTLAGKLLYS